MAVPSRAADRGGWETRSRRSVHRASAAARRTGRRSADREGEPRRHTRCELLLLFKKKHVLHAHAHARSRARRPIEKCLPDVFGPACGAISGGVQARHTVRQVYLRRLHFT